MSARIFLMGFAMAVVLLVANGSDSRAQTEVKLPGDVKRGAELAETCAMCHGKNGMGYPEGIPRIVGQSAAYVRAQLHQFRLSAELRNGGLGLAMMSPTAHLKSSARSFAPKDDILLGLTDQDIADVAEYYKAQKCVPLDKPTPARPATATRCEICHGKGGTKVKGAVPSIASQHAVYLSRQLKFFRAAKSIEEIDLMGEKATRYSRIMFTHARWLTDGLIKEVAKYYESIPCKN